MQKDQSIITWCYSVSKTTIMMWQASYYHGVKVPAIKESARQLFVGASMALAAGDVSQLKSLTTPKCFAQLKKSMSSSRVNLIARIDVTGVSVQQVRTGHLRVAPQYRFIQATCCFTSDVAWSRKESGGKTIGNPELPSAETGKKTYWVMERRFSMEDKNEDSGWRLKARLPITEPNNPGS
ncbi:hypothetical protein AB1Y20_002484 [Prymnesium parvum]|uniref:Tim44-like domain-containing protein n=1 Tax=Prymnesium parvum TaxID=97485 RepID=A0AB34J9E2_PRYPA